MVAINNQPSFEVKVGQWYGIGDDGLFAFNENDDFSVVEGFRTKRQLIEYIRLRLQDAYKNPHIRKVRQGYYKLLIKFEDDLYVYDIIYVSDNEILTKLKSLYEEFLSEPL